MTNTYRIHHRATDQYLGLVEAEGPLAACQEAARLNLRGDRSNALGYTCELSIHRTLADERMAHDISHPPYRFRADGSLERVPQPPFRGETR